LHFPSLAPGRENRQDTRQSAAQATYTVTNRLTPIADMGVSGQIAAVIIAWVTDRETGRAHHKEGGCMGSRGWGPLLSATHFDVALLYVDDNSQNPRLIHLMDACPSDTPCASSLGKISLASTPFPSRDCCGSPMQVPQRPQSRGSPLESSPFENRHQDSAERVSIEEQQATHAAMSGRTMIQYNARCMHGPSPEGTLHGVGCNRCASMHARLKVEMPTRSAADQ
jgi:hypothetical protein